MLGSLTVLRAQGNGDQQLEVIYHFKLTASVGKTNIAKNPRYRPIAVSELHRKFLHFQ